ncbi:8-oxo-dGTP diphosphatase [Peribacillus sp. SI8-4]|uniref:NUDIX hydrolase n=1 Tax=Peribacillus sp. SI8-4 TaxID=3048009 RepID=UPI0025522D08|nr:8-oxo-dGTP diphosphatase [Peribacillus sp. SI8-4]
MKITYTICFITRTTCNGDEVLMLFRRKKPNRGKWNGIGGKIEKGETVRESMEREICEETGLSVRRLTYRGIVTWNETGGMYVYRAEAGGDSLSPCDEGELAWKPFQWIMTANEVVPNIKHYLSEVLLDAQPLEFACMYENDRFISMKKKPLPHSAEESVLTYS